MNLKLSARVLMTALLLTGVALGCSSKVCTTSEESACTSTYTSCINTAALTADKVACQKCVDDYCACYSACGNTCNKAQLSGQCQ